MVITLNRGCNFEPWFYCHLLLGNYTYSSLESCTESCSGDREPSAPGDMEPSNVTLCEESVTRWGMGETPGCGSGLDGADILITLGGLACCRLGGRTFKGLTVLPKGLVFRAAGLVVLPIGLVFIPNGVCCSSHGASCSS